MVTTFYNLIQNLLGTQMFGSLHKLFIETHVKGMSTTSSQTGDEPKTF